MSAEIQEKQRYTRVFVDWHIKNGYHVNYIDPTYLLDIVNLKEDKTITHKDSVFLMKYYQVAEWYQKQPKEWVAAVEELFENEN